MLIDDHINLLGTNPLIGPNEGRFGRRFPDMSEAYSKRLRALATDAAAVIGLPVEHGVYLAVTGPSYETPAEIRAFRTLGADAVGMSTVPEAIVAGHMGLEVLGISCISNMAAGMLPQPLTEEEVIETTGGVRDRFIGLLRASLTVSDDTLVAAAREARLRAIAPYSNFRVGAALVTAGGRVLRGCNIENASYGLTVCAERVALLKALSDGEREFTAIAVVANTAEPTPPCGPCRQLLWDTAATFPSSWRISPTSKGGTRCAISSPCRSMDGC